jgi:ATP-binding cassette subfamily B protein
MSFPFYRQLDEMDCGPTCLRMIAKYYGKNFSLQTLRDKANLSRDGVSLLGLANAAEAVGLHTMGVQITFEQLVTEVNLPCIVYWRQEHFVVIHKIIKQNLFFAKNQNYAIHVADPAKGMMTYSFREFMDGWSSQEETGIALMLEAGPEFNDIEDEEDNDKLELGYLLKYAVYHKKLIFQLLVGMLAGAFLQFLFPFLTQMIVDTGIRTNDFGFIKLILFGQIAILVGQTFVEFIRSWILMFISARINLSILSDFFIKLMRLPVSFFDTKKYGDIMQRISDHYRIDNFLTSNSVSFLFSLLTIVVFGSTFAYFSIQIFLIFLIGSLLYISWAFIFMKYRKVLDNKRFDIGAKSQNSTLEIIRGMQEIKLAGAEVQKQWQWEKIQVRNFKLNLKTLSLNQYQQAGGYFFNHGKNILISYIAAQAVILGRLTLGEMLAIQYLIGQLNSPIEQTIQFLHSFQDARLSLTRLNEIHTLENEDVAITGSKIAYENANLVLDNVCFKYPGAEVFTLNNISLTIELGKTTAIVGASGSGKTTLLKLLLKFYPPSSGTINLGRINLEALEHKAWRKNCGAVLQDGYIFSDSIAGNVALGEENIDGKQLAEAVRIANIREFLDTLPLGLQTKIGEDGIGISQGQRQRIFIARAVYKSPDFLFFDEATSSLDSNNESVIVRNLESLFKSKTAVIVAHRLSTVKNADQIIVMDQGSIIEQGTHFSLIEKKGAYFELIKNQLELAK